MLAVSTAVYGRVSDLVGQRLPLLVGVCLMTGGALAGALAPNFGVLLSARIIQGAGAAAVPTLGVAIVTARFAGASRGVALGRVAGLAAAVSCLGPLAGGAVEGFFGWRAVIALPMLGALLLPLLWRSVPTGGSGARLDLLGAGLVAATAAGVVLLVQSPSTGPLVALVGAVLAVLGVPAADPVGAPPTERLPAGQRHPQRRGRAQRRWPPAQCPPPGSPCSSPCRSCSSATGGSRGRWAWRCCPAR